ncbi:lactate utilization protein [Denitratisoma sp. agr-D3]
MSARANILAKLRQALPDAGAIAAAPVPAVADYYAAHGPATLDGPERVARLASLLEAAHAEVIVTDEGAWPRLVVERLAALGAQRLVLDTTSAEARQLAAVAKDLTLISFDRPIETWKQELFDRVDAGFTVADSAIAATGALVLKSSPSQPRSLSLVPPLHVALVRQADIHNHLFDAARDESWAAGLPTNLIMVSGPSKTSDIQQTLAYGAHGPKQMLVVIVQEGGAA